MNVTKVEKEMCKYYRTFIQGLKKMDLFIKDTEKL